MATYEEGDSDSEIELFQAKLGVEADGEFGPQTSKAVKAWQKANGQPVDGMVGPDMLLALGLTQMVLLENGDTGNLVKRVQAKLSVDADGEYGDKTEKAVKAFQKANGIKANGIADWRTLQAMGVTGAAAPVAKASAKAKAPPAPVAKQVAPPASVPTVGQTEASSGGIQSWAYQLADIDVKEIAALDVDLVVIDYAADGSAETAFKPADLALMKRRPSGGMKKVVSYMSIGEAEDYRFYWQAAWSKKASRPAWLDDLNPDWEGNYKVRFWDPEWQAVILGSPQAYLDQIIAAGFDGVYLDIIDAFEYWKYDKPERDDADQLMIQFVTRIAQYARSKRPDFMIIPQNGEALLEDAAYRSVISAQAKEDIFYGADGDGKPNKKGDVKDCLDYLSYARKDGIPIIAIEYLKDGKKIADAEARLVEAGCTAYFGPRALDKVIKA